MSGHIEARDKGLITVESVEPIKDKINTVVEPSFRSFIEMGVDYEFFTPALAMAVGGFDRDIVQEFVLHHPGANEDADPFAIDADEPFFVGIGIQERDDKKIDWDRRLYGIVRDRWFLCRDFLSAIAWVDPNTKTYSRLGFHEFPLIDPVAVRRGGIITEIPRFPVTSFAVSSTRRFSYLNPARPGKPQLVHEPPKAAILQEARAAGLPDPDPHGLHRFKSRPRREPPTLGTIGDKQ